MLDLLASFSVMQILTFLILGVLALIGEQDVIDFFKGKYIEKFNKDYKKLKDKDDINEQLKVAKENHEEILKICESFDDKLDTVVGAVDELKSIVDELTQSDMHYIKQYIVREYHYFAEEKKQIDDYSLDCILIRYNDYKKEGGNSYIDTLIEELKRLPKCPPKE